MPEISAAIMTLNEEEHIGECLESLRDIADEILILDSFSTDRTEEICRQYGARFIKHPFEGYLEQRQRTIDMSAYDHILVIDGDEVLSDALREEIIKVKHNWTHDGYAFNRLNNFCGRWIHHSGWYPDRKLRLFDRRRITLKGRPPHDEVIMNPGARKKHIKGDLLHYTYASIEDQIRQIDNFTTIQSRAYFQAGKKTSYPEIIFGSTYKFMRHYFFRLGFLDGYYGYILCRNMAHSTFLRHAKLKMLWKNKR